MARIYILTTTLMILLGCRSKVEKDSSDRIVANPPIRSEISEDSGVKLCAQELQLAGSQLHNRPQTAVDVKWSASLSSEGKLSVKSEEAFDRIEAYITYPGANDTKIALVEGVDQEFEILTLRKDTEVSVSVRICWRRESCTEPIKLVQKSITNIVDIVTFETWKYRELAIWGLVNVSTRLLSDLGQDISPYAVIQEGIDIAKNPQGVALALAEVAKSCSPTSRALSLAENELGTLMAQISQVSSLKHADPDGLGLAVGGAVIAASSDSERSSLSELWSQYWGILPGIAIGVLGAITTKVSYDKYVADIEAKIARKDALKVVYDALERIDPSMSTSDSMRNRLAELETIRGAFGNSPKGKAIEEELKKLRSQIEALDAESMRVASSQASSSAEVRIKRDNALRIKKEINDLEVEIKKKVVFHKTDLSKEISVDYSVKKTEFLKRNPLPVLPVLIGVLGSVAGGAATYSASNDKTDAETEELGLSLYNSMELVEYLESQRDHVDGVHADDRARRIIRTRLRLIEFFDELHNYQPPRQ